MGGKPLPADEHRKEAAKRRRKSLPEPSPAERPDAPRGDQGDVDDLIFAEEEHRPHSER